MTEWHVRKVLQVSAVLAGLLFMNLTQAQDANEPVKPAAPPKTEPAQPKSKAMDRLDLENTVITGNRELPKVLYIVPWKKADLGDLGGRPANSLLDEVLAPVDRDVFRRQTEYYTRLNESTPPPAGNPATDK